MCFEIRINGEDGDGVVVKDAVLTLQAIFLGFETRRWKNPSPFKPSSTLLPKPFSDEVVYQQLS